MGTLMGQSAGMKRWEDEWDCGIWCETHMDQCKVKKNINISGYPITIWISYNSYIQICAICSSADKLFLKI